MNSSLHQTPQDKLLKLPVKRLRLPRGKMGMQELRRFRHRHWLSPALFFKPWASHTSCETCLFESRFYEPGCQMPMSLQNSSRRYVTGNALDHVITSCKSGPESAGNFREPRPEKGGSRAATRHCDNTSLDPTQQRHAYLPHLGGERGSLVIPKDAIEQTHNRTLQTGK